MTVLAFMPPARTFSRQQTRRRAGKRKKSPPPRRTGRRPGRQQTYSRKPPTPPAVQAWRPPVPEPLPPAPLLSPLYLLAVGAVAALSQLWGGLARIDRRGNDGGIQLPGGDFPFVKGSWSPTGANEIRFKQGAWLGKRYENGQCGPDVMSSAPGDGSWGSWLPAGDGLQGVRYRFTDNAFCGGWSQQRVEIVRGDGSLILGPEISGGGTYWREWLGELEFRTSAPDAQPVDQGPLIDLPPLSFPAVPEVAPAPLSLPQPEVAVPVPLPLIAPVTQPGPAPSAPAPGEATRPAVAPSPAPMRPQTPAGPVVEVVNGSVVAPAPAPTPSTPTGSVIPWPGGPTVGGPGQSPQPTLTGIAQEVGRIERKIDSIMAPRPAGPSGDPGNWMDQLDDLWDFLERVEPGGSYELRGVCEVDENGEPVETVVEHPWPPGLGSNLGVTGRLDAIAAMLQTHKELRQPICRNPKPQGESVTVQFEEL